MTEWEDEPIPYLSTGSFAFGGGRPVKRAKKVNTGFRNPGDEFPAKPKPRAKAKPTKPLPRRRQR